MQLPDDAFWLLNRIASGRGNPVGIECRTKRDEALIEALEDSGLIVVGAASHGCRASIVDRGREAIKRYRSKQAEAVARCVGRVPGKKEQA